MMKPNQIQIIPNNAKTPNARAPLCGPLSAAPSLRRLALHLLVLRLSHRENKCNPLSLWTGRVTRTKGSETPGVASFDTFITAATSGMGGRRRLTPAAENGGLRLRERRCAELTPMRRVLISFLGLYLESCPCKFSSADASTHPRRSARYLTFE